MSYATLEIEVLRKRTRVEGGTKVPIMEGCSHTPRARGQAEVGGCSVEALRALVVLFGTETC